MTAVNSHSTLAQIIDTQVGLRTKTVEDIHYAKQPNGAFEKDVEEVVLLLKEKGHLVPKYPLWSSLCANFAKGRCSFDYNCKFVHGNVLFFALREFRRQNQAHVIHKIPLNFDQSERLLQRVQQASPPAASSALQSPSSGPQRDVGIYGLQGILPSFHPYATINLEQLFAADRHVDLADDPHGLFPNNARVDFYQQDGAPLFIRVPEPTPYQTQQNTPVGSPYQTPDVTPRASSVSKPLPLPSASEPSPARPARTITKPIPAVPKPIPAASKQSGIATSNPFDLLADDISDDESASES